MSDYTQLKVWQKAHKLVLHIYRLTGNLPEDEKYGLVSQLRRAASAIPINIAEGSGRRHKKEFIQFLNIARGSVSEVEYELLLTKDLRYIDESTYEKTVSLVVEIGRMLSGLIAKVRQED